MANGAVQPTMQFLAELRRNPDFRLLQLVPDHKRGAEVWLSLREPTRLKEVLLRMSSVSEVGAVRSLSPGGNEVLLDVQLVNSVGLKQSPEMGSVMVVEDAPDFQNLVVLLLSQEPYFNVTHISACGEEALESFPQVNPELVLMDFRLPGIDGLETAKRMKNQRPEVKIALVTGFVEDVLERIARRAIVDEVIPKIHLSLARITKLLNRDS